MDISQDKHGRLLRLNGVNNGLFSINISLCWSERESTLEYKEIYKLSISSNLGYQGKQPAESE
jgi:hypothetical protein